MSEQKKENRREERQVKFRVDEAEYEKLSYLAEQQGMSVPNFVKSKAQGTRLRNPKVEIEGAKEIARQLRYYNSNLNQLVKWINTNKTLYEPTELTAMEQQLSGIQEGVKGLWEQLSR